VGSSKAERWVAALSDEDLAFLIDCYLHPRPRIALREALRDHARAAMDVSDGLAGDLAKMLRVSGVTAEIDADRIPFSPAGRAAMRAAPELFERAVTGGDDYEILCTLPENRLDRLREKADSVGIGLSMIGRVVSGVDLPVFRTGGLERRYDVGSFSHF
jgi:thiamine-monophosphate kinase